MISPITGKEMQVRSEIAPLSFRKENFDVFYQFYECETSGIRFTDDALDKINITQVHNSYRAKYGIPFPDEIRQIRQRYGISANKMSEILGLGANSYRLYETGDVPSVAIGRLILSIKQPEEFIKQVSASSHIISKREADKLITNANLIINEWDKNKKKLFGISFHNNFAGELTGYKTLDLDKVSGIISYFNTVHAISLCKTKLNKLLFYTDFNAYQVYGYSMSGLSYQAIQYGPVPFRYDRLYLKLCESEKITIREKEYGDGIYGDDIRSNEKFDSFDFQDIDIEILEFVANKYGFLQTKIIVDRSHKETAWIENHEDSSLINYRYAFCLNEKISPKVIRELDKDLS
ncbi:type II toxin-antitoxin system antitoxin SocA domain-containing protein [Dyadobacter subterraneus]|uniref:DUF4065 domain-containing protein n=1 Tax=Dyadobacter subterraneus TaxID=2773304 RepID=A0ABR9WJ00_9BACT|nr:type II toxin-antitoxin system antitoxin SocA domain-containing protein [Dyadobacter subterraneus]MBE9465492.1 DUF4065 domain-containing protein [Dyadobacter subterraneus]